MSESNEQFEEILKEVNSEVDVDNSKSINSVSTDDASESDSELSYPHEKIMKEEGITKNDLPDDLRKMVITFERKRRMATTKKASEATFLKIQNLSTLIADKIVDYIESDIPTKEDGGGIEGMEGMEGMEMDDGGIDDLGDGDVNIDDDIESKENGGMFKGILGGILDW
jgi:hypothetical protein